MDLQKDMVVMMLSLLEGKYCSNYVSDKAKRLANSIQYGKGLVSTCI